MRKASGLVQSDKTGKRENLELMLWNIPNRAFLERGRARQLQFPGFRIGLLCSTGRNNARYDGLHRQSRRAEEASSTVLRRYSGNCEGQV